MSDFKIKIGDVEYSTGLKKPDEIPLSFTQFPSDEILSLRDLKLLYTNENRIPVLDLYKRRKQQGRKSSCCAYAATTACEVKRNLDGKDDVEFGPEYLYTLINGGVDEGALLDHAMKALLGLHPRTNRETPGYGCCLRDAVPYQVHTLDSMSMEEKRFAKQQAEDYQALDWLKMPHGDLDACWKATVSSIARREPVLMAVHCGSNFFNTPSSGINQADRGVGNHAVVGVDLVGVENASSYSDIKIATINSHGKRFGNDGCYLHTIRHMEGPVRYHQHCSCRAMRTSPDEEISTLL